MLCTLLKLLNFVKLLKLFSWTDKEGLQHAMTHWACDIPDSTWNIFTLNVTDKEQLPIKVSIFQKSFFIKSLFPTINSNLTLNHRQGFGRRDFMKEFFLKIFCPFQEVKLSPLQHGYEQGTVKSF